MVALSLVLNALSTQKATFPARSAIMLTCGVQDKSAETVTPGSFNVFKLHMFELGVGWRMDDQTRNP